jgi:CRP-like cAMP-binding protein
VLANSLKYDEFESSEVILHEGAFASKAQILTRGIARITCRTPRLGRVTIAFVAPGLIPQLPSLSPSRFDFRCEAHNDCRVGSLARGDFNAIATRGSESARNAFHQNNLRQWHRVLSRSSDFLTADLHERIAATMLELAVDFGVTDSRGILLKDHFSPDDIADLVGATRPRITEHLAQCEKVCLAGRVDGSSSEKIPAVPLGSNDDSRDCAEEPSLSAEAILGVHAAFKRGSITESKLLGSRGLRITERAPPILALFSIPSEAEITMTGTIRRRESLLRSRRKPQPSSTGMTRSRRISFGNLDLARSN